MLRFTFCVLGIYACFLTWGVVQEQLTTTPYGPPGSARKFKYFIFLNVIQSLLAAIVASVFLLVTRKPLAAQRTFSKPGLLFKYLQVAFFNCIGSPFGYAALKHIDYPTMILGKSCKLIPVMLMGIILYRRQFSTYKYVCVGLITTGVSLFMLWHPVENKKGAAASSAWGLFLLAMNLCVDGITNATQDQIFHRYGKLVSGQHMMLYMNAFCTLLMALYLAVNPSTHEFAEAVVFCSDHPRVIRDILLFGMCGALGQCFIFYTLERYGSLRLVTVTVTRKLFTMLLSVVWFNHHLSIGQWAAVGLVFSGIGLEAYIKRQQKLAKIQQASKVEAVEKVDNDQLPEAKKAA